MTTKVFDYLFLEKLKVNKLNREKEDLEKQVALINGQLLLVESSKKRLDEVVEDLQTEIVHLRKELEEAEKQYVLISLHRLHCKYIPLLSFQKLLSCNQPTAVLITYIFIVSLFV